MNILKFSGAIDPARSFDLRTELEPMTSEVRPMIIVDLSSVTELHPSGVSVLMAQARRARQHGGSFHVVAPTDVGAANTLDLVGLQKTLR